MAVAVVTLLAMLTIAGPAYAVTITVDTTADVVDGADGLTSLREAIDVANATPGDDAIVLGAGTYTLTIGGTGDNNNRRGDLDHTEAAGLSITGAGSGTTVITTTLDDRVLHMRRGDLTLANLTITGGRVQQGAGVYSENGSVTASGVVFSDNTTTGNRVGGAVRVRAGSFTGTDATFTGNDARDGGALHVRNGTTTLTNVIASGNTARRDGSVINTNRALTVAGGTFTGNTAVRNGGVFRVSGDATAVTTLTTVVADGNAAGRDGGVVQSSRTVSVTGGSFTGNAAGRHGGVLRTGNNSPLQITDAVFSTNTAVNQGGAVRAAREPALVDGATFSANVAGRGGAIWIDEALTVTATVFSANRATVDDAGAVWAQRRAASLTATTFSGNTAARDGGALRLAVGGTFTASTFDGNTAGRDGGAVRGYQTVTFQNSTVTANTAAGRGGAIRGARVDATHTTLVANTAPTGANVDATDFRPVGTVIALGTGGADCAATTTSGGGNFDGDGSCGLGGPGDVSAGGDPLLGPLGANGGSTQTMLPLPGSPLTDATTAALTVDQRGIARPQGSGAEIGSVEVREPGAVDDTAVTDEDQAVVVSVLGNDPDPDGQLVPAAVVTVSAPANGATTDNGDGTITYTPDLNYNGSDSFGYDNGFATATVNVTVDSVNDVPTAGGDSASTDEDQAVNIDVLTNDGDIDGDPLTVTIVVDPANGAAVVPADGTVTYTPNADFNGTDAFDYQVDDGNGGTATATVNVTVVPVNDAPVVDPDAVMAITLTEDGTITFDPTVWFIDVDGDPLVVESVGPAANGATAVGSITYTPDPDYFGPDAFDFTVGDGNGGSITASVAATVTAVDDAPEARDDVAVVAKDTPITINVLSNDFDIEGDPMTVTVTGATNGTATVVGNQVRFMPANGYIGPASVTYQVEANGLTDDAVVQITVEDALPATGLDTDHLGIIGITLVLLGALALFATRRREDAAVLA